MVWLDNLRPIQLQSSPSCAFRFYPLLLWVLFVPKLFSSVPFAEKPPANESIQKLFAKKVNLEPEVQGKPLPTNDWWTTLLANEDFPGRLYAYPFTVSAMRKGFKFGIPWNGMRTVRKWITATLC